MSWVLKIKDNGIYHSLLVSKGFIQREVMEYYLSHSKVLCDITCLMLETILDSILMIKTVNLF